VRVVNVVLLRLICLVDGGEEDFEKRHMRYLVECSETFADGRERIVSRLPGSKKEPHENTRKVAERVTEEMLNMSDCELEFDFEYGIEEFEEGVDESLSYPGVRTVYRKTIVEGFVETSDPEVLKRIGRGSETDAKWSFTDSKGSIRTFEWLTEEQCEEADIQICAPKTTGDEISCLVKAPLGFSEEKLLDFLSSNNIDSASFGARPGSKTLKELAHETKHGESSLIMDPDGQVLRVVDIVLLKLTREGGSQVLMQVDEAPTNNTDQKTVLNRLLGAKLSPTDNQFVTAYACLTKMLSIDENSVDFDAENVEFIQSVELSESYPGLLTLYRRRIISGEVIFD